jgi:polar amino acid transport system substrate-binding protein
MHEIEGTQGGDGMGLADEESELHGLWRLAALTDGRDPLLATHSERVSEYAGTVARELKLDAARVNRLMIAGLVHDVGKITVPDWILAKPGSLTSAEWEKVQQHPDQGAWLVAAAGFDDVAHWVLCHHERIDGGGYPQGLTRGEIPLEARILAVADAYEAMTSDRVYRARLGHRAASRELLQGSGSQFDEVVVAAFLCALGSAQAGTDERPAGINRLQGGAQRRAAHAAA